MTTKLPNARSLLAVLALAAILFLSNIWRYDLWPPDEPRFAQVAREMIESGDWLTLRVNGAPYMEKPPLFFWSIAVISAPFGDVTETSARLPSVLAALLTVWFTYLLARSLYDERTARWSAIVLITAVRFWWQARTCQTDMLLTACLTFALLAFWMWVQSRSRRWLWTFYAGIAAAVFTKGPPGLVFPILLIVAYFWGRREERRSLRLPAGLLAIAALACLWIVPARLRAAPELAGTAGELMATDVLRHTLGRFFLGVSKARGPWYYFLNLPLDWLPWSLFLPWVIPWVWRRRRQDDRMRLLLSWTVPAFIFFTISIGKRQIYLLPIYPALAVLTARSVLDLMDGDASSVRCRRVATAWAIVLVLLAAATPAVHLTEYEHRLGTASYLFSVAAVICLADLLYAVFKKRLADLHTVLPRHFVVLALCTVFFVLPAVDAFKSARGFCEPIRNLAEAGVEFRLYSVGFSREEYIYYSKHFHEPVLTDLLLVEMPDGMTRIAMAKQQKRLREDMAEAAMDVSLSDLAHVTDGEIEVLQQAIQDRILRDSRLDARLAQQFKKALAAQVDAFAAMFAKPGPAFLFVQEQDWRWLLAVDPSLREFEILQRQSVGRRDVLLVANHRGATTTAERD